MKFYRKKKSVSMWKISVKTKEIFKRRWQLIPQTALSSLWMTCSSGWQVFMQMSMEETVSCFMRPTNRSTAPSWLCTRLHYKQTIPSLPQHPSRQEVGLFDPFYSVVHILIKQQENILPWNDQTESIMPPENVKAMY